nr:hypothetical protein BaRGS_020051 [Batillaria attramentaria]
MSKKRRKESDHGQGPDMVNETSTTESGHEQDTEQPASTADSQEEMNQQAKLTPNINRDQLKHVLYKAFLSKTKTRTSILELASRLEKAQEKASLLETQLSEVKQLVKQSELKDSQQGAKLNSYRQLAETCHTKYKQHKEMADKLQAQMDDIKKKMEDRDEEIQDMSEQLNKLRRLAAARKKQIKQIKAREADTEAEREKSLDHTRVRRELEFQYRADLGQVIRNLARFLDKSQAALEQAELTKNEMDFRQRVDAGNARKYMSRQQHLAALEEASKMETLLLRDIYRETGPASVTRRPPALSVQPSAPTDRVEDQSRVDTALVRLRLQDHHPLPVSHKSTHLGFQVLTLAENFLYSPTV